MVAAYFTARPTLTTGPLLPRTISGRTVRFAVLVTPEKFVEMVTPVGKRTGSVDTLKLAVADPAATTTLEGTIAARKLLLVRETAIPPAGAGPLKMTVPTEGRPPVTLEGLSVTEARTGGRTMIGALTVPPLKYAEIVTEVAVETGAVVTANVALLAHSGMVAGAATR